MSLSRMVFTDRTGLFGAGGGLLAGLPPELAAVYLLLRLLIPVLLVVLAGRGATPTQRIGLVRDYLLGAPVPDLADAPTPALPPSLSTPDPADATEAAESSEPAGGDSS
jgi:hypothetical protein